MSATGARGVPESELIPISALQHMLYCPRRCALIHVERQWVENRFTAEGRLLHERVDAGGHERRRGVRIARGVAVRSLRLGVAGIADVVEVGCDDRSLYPVEYKRGRPMRHRADQVQLCAQALCLEEMLARPVPEGALFYGRSRRRRAVAFDKELRELTERTVADTRRLLDCGGTPLPEYEAAKCEACSLMDICQPRKPRGSGVVYRWLAAAIDG